MMRGISMCALLFLVTQTAYSSISIYGSAFDYKKAVPTSSIFSGKSHEEIRSLCKKEPLGTMELSACAQFQYEESMVDLNKRVSEIVKTMKDGDRKHRANRELEALPFFKKAQANWKLYRDNNCYASVYEVGQASLRFVDFWDCMTRMTRNRLDELTRPNASD
jgi:uncharacterized protein YecT (DUF1311 family)